MACHIVYDTGYGQDRQQQRRRKEHGEQRRHRSVSGHVIVKVMPSATEQRTERDHRCDGSGAEFETDIAAPPAQATGPTVRLLGEPTGKECSASATPRATPHDAARHHANEAR